MSTLQKKRTSTGFSIHDVESAPEASKAFLAESKKAYGFVASLHAVMAEAPGLLEAYRVVGDLFQNSSFDAEEITVVWQTINVEHNCTYCVPAHTGVANMMQVDPALTEALRNQEPMTTEKLQVLHETTLKIVRSRGMLTADDLAAFYAVGYGQRQLLEIILGLSQKTMSNYVNHIAKTEVDPVFKKYAWEKKK